MNKKGNCFLPVALITVGGAAGVPTATLVMGWLLTAAISLPTGWHIYAWGEAKKNHNEVNYQAQEMWPQQLFDKLPGGGAHSLNYKYAIGGSSGNNGNLKGGNSEVR